ncbi:MAG: TIGR02757 family protein [Bacteroidia bacterium]|nr:TIGR02757 family protein [Bacteroidia bacterium]
MNLKIQNVKNELDSILDAIKPMDFIDNDPISIPKRFSKKQDIEISSFFASILAWGQRKTIIKNTNKLMGWMGEEPHRFIMNHSDADLKVFESFVHRTFNSTDCLYFIEVLKQFYLRENSLENYFKGDTVKSRLINFRNQFFNYDFAPQRTKKHIANPSKNSSAKRLNMFLRWMVRKDEIDFGIWKSIKPAELRCPLDVHVQRAAFHFGLLSRKQQDWKAVDELSDSLVLLDPLDPIKYDLALFKWSESRVK